MTLDEMIAQLQGIRDEVGGAALMMLEYDGQDYPARKVQPLNYGTKAINDSYTAHRICNGRQCNLHNRAPGQYAPNKTAWCQGHITGIQIR